MILFEKDWINSNAIIDYSTRNKSALILAEKLKRMGIKNNAFFLALHDTTLQGVNPYDPNLTLEQMTRIGIEIKINCWYYFREIARAPAIAGTEPDVVELNRGNVSLWWSFYNHITYILTQPRQTGKSFSTDHLMTLLMGFSTNNTQINLLTKDDDLRGKNIKRLKDIYDELPPYLKLKNKKDSNNTEAITINALGNSYNTYVPQMSPKAAYKLGRGLTSPIFHIDEPPFQPNIEISLPSALAAMGAAIDKAKLTNEPYGVILTTTAGKKDDKDGKYIYNYAHDSALWTEHFYDAADADELKQMVTKNSRKGVFRIYGSFTHKQLGKTDLWLKEKLENSNQIGDDANRDFFNIWTSGTQSSPLPIKILEKLTSSIIPEEHISISEIGKYITKWYIPEKEIDNFMRTRTTSIGVDTSDASGGDECTFVMTDTQSGATIAIATINETNLITLTQWLMSWLIVYEKTTMIIERKSSAITIIDYMLLFLPPKGIDPFKRLFNWIINDPYEHKERYQEAMLPMNRRPEDVYDRCKKYFGFATSGGGETARSGLYSVTLQNAAKRCADRVLDKSLTQQITGLIIRNGRVDHEVGSHDDLVVSWLLSHWLLTMAKNISYYGIDPANVLIETNESINSNIEYSYKDIEQAKYRDRIKELFTLLSQEANSYICERYEKELRYLDSKLILKDNEFFSLADTINKARDENRQRKKDNFVKHSNHNYNDVQTHYSHLDNVVLS